MVRVVFVNFPQRTVCIDRVSGCKTYRNVSRSSMDRIHLFFWSNSGNGWAITHRNDKALTYRYVEILEASSHEAD